jgi:hypothetical protein
LLSNGQEQYTIGVGTLTQSTGTDNTALGYMRGLVITTENLKRFEVPYQLKILPINKSSIGQITVQLETLPTLLRTSFNIKLTKWECANSV